ncbi:MAG: gliding motility-associated-like protein [Glaciecola sp.]|jgi:gliding motility-associated-like protein
MNRLLFLLLIISSMSFGQNVQTDATTYTAQQLIEDILIDSNCIENVIVTNVVGGDFGGTDQSYGYFDASGTSFPFQNGIVLSTGRLQNVDGPNTTLSDDDATGWSGDSDLEQALNETNTINATILEFEFTAIADQISFRYLFASEEYQEGNANTCQFSDLFGFLVRPASATQYENIALVPGTTTPVKVTTVHPAIPNGCAAQNEAYFGSWNNATAPINFNGQTAVLEATTTVIPNQTYHVKLVIADEQNFRYDSAVFLEAGSFKLFSNLGNDKLLANSAALCENETLELNAFEPGLSTYKWFKNGIEILGEINAIYEVVDAGTYEVEVILDSGCESSGSIIIEYSENPEVFDATLTECDFEMNGFATYNLYDAATDLINGDNSLQVENFFLTLVEAELNTNPITNTSSFQNTSTNQIVYALIVNQNNCSSIAELQLRISTAVITIDPFEQCNDEQEDGFTEFNLNDVSATFQSMLPANATVSYYETLDDAYNETNALASSFENSTIDQQTIYVRIESNSQCYAISTVDLIVLYTPILEPDVTANNPIYYCLDSYPETKRLFGGVLFDLPSNYYYLWNTGENTSFIDVNEIGTYSVTVSDPNGCSSSRSIVVVASEIANINEVLIEGGNTYNTVTISVSGSGNYEYALDNTNGFYQSSNVFTNVLAGFHTVYVRDINGCGIVSKLISVLGFPKFLTPNNDGYHDTWKVNGINALFHDGITIHIFNRTGKLITSLNNQTPGWDGNFNGRPLPSDDYWYSATLIDGQEYRGHFTLKR